MKHVVLKKMKTPLIIAALILLALLLIYIDGCTGYQEIVWAFGKKSKDAVAAIHAREGAGSSWHCSDPNEMTSKSKSISVSRAARD